MATTESSGQKLLKKLTIKDCVGGKPAILAAAMTGKAKPEDKVGKAVPILQVIGQVSGFVPGESDMGAYVKLKGVFQATNLITGEVFDGLSTAILPDVVADLAVAVIKSGSDAASFVIEIDVHYDEAAATMYVYSVRSLLKAAPAAPLLGLIEQVKASGVKMTTPLAIAAPKLSEADAKKQAAAEQHADATKGKAKATA